MEDVPSTGSLEALRHRNRQRVVGALARTGLASRADLARSTGLSRTTVSSLVGELLEAGIVVEREDVPGTSPTPGGGRPPVLLGLDRSAGAAIGLDLGHSHIRAAVADPRAHGRRRPDSRPATSTHCGLDALDHICDLVEDSIERSGFSHDAIIGLGGRPAPGRCGWARARSGRRRSCPGWQGVPIARDARGPARHQRPGRERRQPRRARRALVRRRAGSSEFVAYINAPTPASAPGSSPTAGSTAAPAAPPASSGTSSCDEHGPVCRCGNRGCLETVAAEGAILELLRRDARAGHHDARGARAAPRTATRPAGA